MLRSFEMHPNHYHSPDAEQADVYIPLMLHTIEIKPENNNCEDEGEEDELIYCSNCCMQQHSVKRKTIRWAALESKIEKKYIKIKIQSNKNKQIKMDKTKEENKQRLSERRREYYWGNADGYFNEMGKTIQHGYESRGATAAGLGGLCIVVGTIIPILPVWYAMDKRNQFNEDENLKHKENYNTQSKAFNAKLKQVKQSEEGILSKRKQLKQQEDTLNSHCFDLEFERVSGVCNDSRVVMVIGPTGFGKSLIANRLLGNEHDIDDIEESSESKQCDFSVAQSGNAKSVTNKLDGKSKIVHIATGEDTEDSFVLSVVDTPGAFDSKGNDDDYNNMMTHYFRACGGINVFAIFFRFNGKMTDRYKELLKQYAEFFGDGLWKHCSIFITRCDMDSDKRKQRITKGLQRTKDRIHSFLKETSNGQCDVPIYTFGEDNFKQSTFDFLTSLIDKDSAFYEKYKCENIRSPIDVLYEELKQKVKQHEKLVKELQHINEKVKEAKDKVNFDEWTKEANELQKDEKMRNEKLKELQNKRWLTDYKTLQKDANEYNDWAKSVNK
eukprot:46568_1